MKSFSINGGDNLVKITVNSQGDSIHFSAADTAFYTGFYDLLNWISDSTQKFKDAQAENKGNKDPQAMLAVIREWNQTSEECMKRIDTLFGPGASQKIFGEGIVSPDVAEFSNFFEQIAPIIEQVASERGQAIKSKYNRERTGGAKKNVQRTAG